MIHFYIGRVLTNGLTLAINKDASNFLRKYPYMSLEIRDKKYYSIDNIRMSLNICGVVVILGHGSKGLTPKSELKPVYNDEPRPYPHFTTFLPDLVFRGGTGYPVDFLGGESKSDTNADALLFLAICNNGYAPDTLIDGTKVIKLLSNVWDEESTRPNDDLPDYVNRGIPVKGGTQVILHIEEIFKQLDEYARKQNLGKL